MYFIELPVEYFLPHTTYCRKEDVSNKKIVKLICRKTEKHTHQKGMCFQGNSCCKLCWLVLGKATILIVKGIEQGR